MGKSTFAYHNHLLFLFDLSERGLRVDDLEWGCTIVLIGCKFVLEGMRFSSCVEDVLLVVMEITGLFKDIMKKL